MSNTSRAAQIWIHPGVMDPEGRLDLLPQDRPIPPRPSPNLEYTVATSGGYIQLGQFIFDS